MAKLITLTNADEQKGYATRKTIDAAIAKFMAAIESREVLIRVQIVRNESGRYVAIFDGLVEHGLHFIAMKAVQSGVVIRS